LQNVYARFLYVRVDHIAKDVKKTKKLIKIILITQTALIVREYESYKSCY